MEKIVLNLNGVTKTLLLPLWGRAIFSKKPYSPIHDALAIELTNNIDFDFAKLSKKVGNMGLFWVARAYYFDQAIRKFLKNYPKGTVVNLGAGLETAFYRVDNRELHWVDLDLPEVIELRRQLLPNNDRIHSIAKSLLDFTWIDDVKKIGENFFLFAGGVFMYFSQPEVEKILLEIARQFPNTHLLFDAISQRALQQSNRILNKVEIKNAELKWCLEDYRELEKWSACIKLCSQTSYLKKLAGRHDLPLSMQVKILLSDMFQKRKIIDLKFLADQ